MMNNEEKLKRKSEWMKQWRKNNPDASKARDRESRIHQRTTRLEEVRQYHREYARKLRKSDKHKANLEKRRERYRMNPDKYRESSRQWMATDAGKEYRKSYLEKWRAANQDKIRDWAIRNAEKRRVQRRAYMAMLRAKVIEAYGGKCVCCGEKQIEFLALDHINNDGKAHRKECGSSTGIYFWARRNGYPKDKLQVLCHNCNLAKEFYGSCPHQKESA